MESSPLYPKFVIPSINQIKIFPDDKFVNKVYKYLLNQKKIKNIKEFGSIYKGLIASGDMFISSNEKLNDLRDKFPELYCVEKHK